MPVTVLWTKSTPSAQRELRRLRLRRPGRPACVTLGPCRRRRRSAARRSRPSTTQARGCTRCPQLAATRNTVVFGAGNADADLMFVGEAPGANEDEQGLPFVGQAGKLLDKLLGEIGLARGDVFVANVLKCRPPGNRDPHPDRDRELPGLPAAPGRAHRAAGHLHARQLRHEAAARRPDRDHAPARARGGARRSAPRGAAVPDLPSRRRRSTRPRTSRSCAPTSRGCRSCWRWTPPPQPGQRGGAPGGRRADPTGPSSRPSRSRSTTASSGSSDGPHAAATGFSRSADAYDRARPDYPPAALAWLGERLDLRPGRTVVDLAAGTGKLTRPLAAIGAEVVAVEPVAEMRARIGPAARALDGTAEAHPAPGRQRRRGHRRPGVPLVRRPEGAGRDRPRPAAGRGARARLEPAAGRVLGAPRGDQRIIAPYRGDAPGARAAAPGARRSPPRAHRGALRLHSAPRRRRARGPRRRRRASSPRSTRRPASRCWQRVRALAPDGPVDVPYECEIHLWRP